MPKIRRNILCIEDDHQSAALISEELGKRGFVVAAAHDSNEAFGSILKSTPDLVLCDINLPNMSGFEILERLKSLAPRLRHVPFVFLADIVDRDQELRARRLGAADYLIKPIDFDMLEVIIEARLGNVSRTGALPRPPMLNQTELDALTWVARGKKSVEIARLMGLTKRTIDFHLDNARVKLGATTRTQAAIKAAIGKLIEP